MLWIMFFITIESDYLIDAFGHFIIIFYKLNTKKLIMYWKKMVWYTVCSYLIYIIFKSLYFPIKPDQTPKHKN